MKKATSLQKGQCLAWLILCTIFLFSANINAEKVTLTGAGTLGPNPTGSWTITGESTVAVPKSGDDITVATGTTLIVDGNFTIGELTFTRGTEFSTKVTISDGVTLTVSGLITINSPSVGTSTNNGMSLLDVGDGHLICTDIKLDAVDWNKKSILRLNNGTITMNGLINMQDSKNSSKEVLLAGAGVLTVNYPAGATAEIITSARGTITPGTQSTVIVNGSESNPVIPGKSFNNLVLNYPSKIVFGATALTINGDLTLNAGFVLNNQTTLSIGGKIKTDHSGDFGADRMISVGSYDVLKITNAYIGTYPLGYDGVYMPIEVTGVSNANPITISSFAGKSVFNTNSTKNALGRSWYFQGNNAVSASLTYSLADVNGTESTYTAKKISLDAPSAWDAVSIDATVHKISFTDVSLGTLGTVFTASEVFRAPSGTIAISTNTNTWATASGWSTNAVPDENANVYLIHNKTIASGVSANSKTLNVEGGADLTISDGGELIVTEGSTLAGRITQGSASANTAKVTFNGKVILNGGLFTSTRITAEDISLFYGGIENNDGVINGGVMTLKRNQAITGSGTSTFSKVRIYDDFILTNESDDLKIGAFTGNGSFANKGTATYTGTTAIPETVILDCSSEGNTMVYENQSSFTIPVVTTYYNLKIVDSSTNGRTKTIPDNLTVLNDLELGRTTTAGTPSFYLTNLKDITIDVGGNLTLTGALTFRPSYPNGDTNPTSLTHHLNIKGALINNGATINNNWNAANVQISIEKSSGIVISGTGGSISVSTASTPLTFIGTGDKLVDFKGSITISTTVNNAGGKLDITTPTVLLGSNANFISENPISFNNLQLGNKNNASATFNADFTINGDLIFATNSSPNNSINLNGKILTLNGDLLQTENSTGYPVFKGTDSPSLVINGTGVLSNAVRFTGETALVNLTVNREGDATVELSSSSPALTVKTLTMTQGALLTNNKLTYADGATLTYNGTASQVIGDEWSNALSPANIVVKNATGISMDETSVYAGNLLLDGGILKLTSGKTLLLDKAPTIQNEGKIELADGSSELQIKTSAKELTFPVATSNGYTPVTASVKTIDNEKYIGVKVVGGAAEGNEDGLKRVWDVNGTAENPSFIFKYVDNDVNPELEDSLYTGYYDRESLDWKRIMTQKADEDANTLSSGSDYGYGKYTGMYDNKAKIVIPEIEGVVFNKLPGIYEIKEGTSFSFIIGIEEGYDNSSMAVTVNETPLTKTGELYIIESVQNLKKYEVNVTGIAKKIYAVTINKPEGVVVKHEGENTVTHGEDFRFTIETEGAFKITVMDTADNKMLLTPSIEGVYVIEAVISNITVEIKKGYKVTIKKPEEVDVNYEGGNVITPEEDFSFTIETEGSFKVTVTDAKGSKTLIPSTEGVYTVESLTSDVTIEIISIDPVGLHLEKNQNVIWTAECKLFVSVSVPGYLYVFNNAGVAQFVSRIGEGLTTIDLPSGFYIVVMNGETSKVFVK